VAALLVVTTSPADCDWVGRRIGIFPGGPTPSMFPAHAPFWIGYGFVPTPGELDGEEPGFLSTNTRFELDLDGERMTLSTELATDDETPVRKTDFVNFPDGLPSGWHEFAGRWYENGSLILSSRARIEFVESEL
jgi:hypothetical protein